MKRPDSIQLSGEITLADEVDDSDGPRPFSMLAYTGAVVDRMWGKAVFDLEGLNVQLPLPILLNHDESKIVGHATKATVTKDGLQLEGVITDKTPEGRMVAELGRDGFPWTSSVGLSGIKWQDLDEDGIDKCNGVEHQGPVSIAREAHCYETSFISAGPADKDTHAAILRGEETNQKEGLMLTPEEFAAQNPAAVEKWRGEGRLATVKVLTCLLAMFPGAAEQVCDAFTKAEGEELPAQAAMAGVLFERLQQQPKGEQLAQASPTAELTAEQRGQAVRSGQVEALAQRVNAPGLGFDGQERETLTDTSSPKTEAQLSALPLEERLKAEWSQNSRERQEFSGDFSAFAATRRREIRRLSRGAV